MNFDQIAATLKSVMPPSNDCDPVFEQWESAVSAFMRAYGAENPDADQAEFAQDCGY